MADYIRESRVWLARPRDAVWALYADPERLVTLMPAWLRLRVAEAPARLTAGSVLEFRLRWLVVPFRWRAFIREWDPPTRFVDVQLRGPFARWEHRHLFLEENGGTRIEDRVTYRLPFGPLGRLAHAALVRAQLDEIWRHRDQRIAKLLAPAPAAAPPEG